MICGNLILPQDIITCIFEYCITRDDYRQIIYVSKEWKLLMEITHPYAQYLLNSAILTAMYKSPHEYHNWDLISRESIVPWILIRDRPHWNWNKSAVSGNPNITWEIVESNPYFGWDWDELSKNSSITWDIVRDNESYPWDFAMLSQNPNITWKIVCLNLELDWDLNQFSHCYPPYRNKADCIDPSSLSSDSDLDLDTDSDLDDYYWDQKYGVV